MIELDQYLTPPILAAKVAHWAKPKGQRVLEPSAGSGEFVWQLGVVGGSQSITAVEIDDALADMTWSRAPAGTIIQRMDFLKYEGWGEHDLALMNPPYGNGRDGAHLGRACRMCPRVVALVRAQAVWGKDRFHDVFRWSRLTKIAVLVRRPNFYRPDGQLHGGGARHDFCVIELQRPLSAQDGAPAVEYDRLKATRKRDRVDRPEVEWWTEDWNAAA